MGSIKLDSGFLLLYDWLPAFETLPGDEFKELFLALVHFQRDRTPIPTFKSPLCNIFAQMIEPSISRRLAGQCSNKKSELNVEGTVDGTVDGTVGDTVDGTVHPSRAEQKKAEHKKAEHSRGEQNGAGAPVLTASPSPAPSPNEDDVFSLVSEGIRESYIRDRQYRAADFARTHNRPILSVLREWWERDKAEFTESYDPTFDTDDFFAAALKRSMGELGTL